jgi:hypothetical protein
MSEVEERGQWTRSAALHLNPGREVDQPDLAGQACFAGGASSPQFAQFATWILPVSGFRSGLRGNRAAKPDPRPSSR